MAADIKKPIVKASKKNAIIISVVVALLFFLVTTTSIWFLTEVKEIVQLLITEVSASALFGLLVYGLISKTKAAKNEQPQQREVINRRQKLLRQHFLRMLRLQKLKKRTVSRYDQPIYLLLTSDQEKDKSIITQMGYEAYKIDDFGNDIHFPILFWLSEHSILISVSNADDQQPEYLKTLCQCLNKWRPRQAVNGLLMTTEVSQLLQPKESISQYADEMKSVITTFNQNFGLSIPVYNVITNMGSISDFCQFFSGFDEAKRGEAFGATSPYQQNGGIDANWFDDEYDHLIGQLISNMNNALSGQLNQDYRKSIASAPFQFGLLKKNLWLLLQRIYRSEQLTDGLMFRGFYFTHNGQDHQQHDLLAGTVNYTLGNESYLQHEQIPVHQTLFAQNLISHVIINEHEIVGVNKRKENSLLFTQVAFTLSWIALLAVTLTILKLDFDHQNWRETRADALLERYKEAVSASPYDIENMADNIPNLYSLHSIYALYLKPDPWYTLSFMPSSNIKTHVQDAYMSALETVLLPSMQHILENDLFVYINLEEQAKTLNLLNSYQLLFNKQRGNIEELKAYFLTALKEQGDTDSDNTAQFNLLIEDVFKQKLVPENIDENLQTLAKKVINQSSIENLLYEHIVNEKQFASHVDIRNELGDKFVQLFNFKSGYIGYLVPYIYTPAGFSELDLSAHSPLIEEALQAYADVAGSSPSAMELYRISRVLKQRYKSAYINYWKDFIQNIEVNSVTTPNELERTISTLAQYSDNPVNNLYTLISRYTSISMLYPVVEKTEKEGDEAVSAEQPQDLDKKEAARQISLNFNVYHEMFKENEQKNRPIDLLLKHFIVSQQWLAKFYESKSPQKLAYETLAATLQADNPILLLSQQTEDKTPLIKELINNLTTLADNMVITLAHSYLNTTWKNEVYAPYQKSLASFYPFNNKAEVDASTADVKAFFIEGGIIDEYRNTRLQGFVLQEDKGPQLAGLLGDNGVVLDAELWAMFVKASAIRQALFLSDPQQVSVQFKMKVLDMSSDLTEFSISTDKPIVSYRHGPTLWQNQAWFGQGQSEETLTIRFTGVDGPIANESTTGSWNWFKLITPRIKNTTAQSTLLEFKQGESTLNLEIKTSGQINPFERDFFSSFNLNNEI